MVFSNSFTSITQARRFEKHYPKLARELTITAYGTGKNAACKIVKNQSFIQSQFQEITKEFSEI